jgi:phosphatidylcholine synthase
MFKGYAVHAYTSFGIILAFIAAKEIASPVTNVSVVFLCFFVAVLIDATDGTLARKYKVKETAAAIDGGTLDNIVDYLNYTFLPLMLMWKMEWLPHPTELWIIPALMASLFGFSNVKAKDETLGYFLGFPSYWNYFAFYFGIWTPYLGKGFNAAVVITLAILSVLPIKFLYPNLAPKKWRKLVMVGAISWQVMLAAMLSDYPDFPLGIVILSLCYPVFYAVLSLSMQKSFK